MLMTMKMRWWCVDTESTLCRESATRERAYDTIPRLAASIGDHQDRPRLDPNLVHKSWHNYHRISAEHIVKKLDLYNILRYI